MNQLVNLHDTIDARVEDIRANHVDWLCRMGCDLCCRRLAEIPRLTEAEWDLLKVGLRALSKEQFLEVSQKITALTEQSGRPIVCPMLDQNVGACSVYDYRPVACRTYGFYVQRDLGLYCEAIKAEEEQGALADVVWGNHDTVDRRLSALGDSHELTDWFAELNYTPK